MRTALLHIMLLAFLGNVVAQDPMPDTVDASRYFPLQIGNMWEYQHDIEDPFDPDIGTRFERYTVIDSVFSDTADYVILYEEFDDGLSPLQMIIAHVELDSTASLIGDKLPGILDLINLLDVDFYASDPGGDWLYVEPGVTGPDVVFDSATVTKRFGTYSFVLEVVKDVGVVRAGPFCEPCGALVRTRRYSLRYASVNGNVRGARVATVNEMYVVDVRPIVVYPNPASSHMTVLGHANESLVLYDIQGRIIRQFSAGPTGRVRVNTEDISRGTYFVQGSEATSIVIIR